MWHAEKAMPNRSLAARKDGRGPVALGSPLACEQCSVIGTPELALEVKDCSFGLGEGGPIVAYGSVAAVFVVRVVVAHAVHGAVVATTRTRAPGRKRVVRSRTRPMRERSSRPGSAGVSPPLIPV